jgi:hypothetical protein
MSVAFNQLWLGGVSGLELIPTGLTTLYSTLISGETPNNGVYTGSGIYTLANIPRDGSVRVFINENEVYSQIVQDALVRVTSDLTGIITVEYAPLSNLLYFGDNKSKVDNGITIVSRLQNIHLTNIMYKIAQIEYTLEVPISMWNNTEVTSLNFNGVEFITDPTIMYSIQTRLNQLIAITNDKYVSGIGTITVTNSGAARKIDVKEVIAARNAIENIQTRLLEVL